MLRSIASHCNLFDFVQLSRPGLVTESLSSIGRPGFVNEWLSYDAGGRLTSNFVTVPGATLRSATFRYDIRDKLVCTVNPAGDSDTLSATYSGFGHVADGTSVSRGRTLTGYQARYVASETVSHDAMGNQMSSATVTLISYPGFSNTSSKSQSYTYEYGTGRLLSAHQLGQTDTVKYDGLFEECEQ